MNVLVACEFSGVVRDAFKKRGHFAVSCDFLPGEGKGYIYHYQGDVFDIIDEDWDLMIAHPPCTYLTVTGNKWFKPKYKDRFPNRGRQREDAVKFFMELAAAPIDKIAIENPVGIMSTRWRKPDQYIQPYWFGDPHRKKTGLWLQGLPKLQKTNVVTPNVYKFKSGRGSYDRGYMEATCLPSKERSKVRSITYQGIADAMADQWGGEL